MTTDTSEKGLEALIVAQNHQAVAGRRMPRGRNGVSSSSRRYNNRGLYYAAAAAGGEAVTKWTFIGYWIVRIRG
jgi:hypothetical protein